MQKINFSIEILGIYISGLVGDLKCQVLGTCCIVLDSGTREPLTRTRTESFARNRNRKFENSPYPEPNRNRLNTWRVPDGS